MIMKGFKVSDVGRSRIVGIACRSLAEMVDKGKTKLKINKNKNVRVYLPDGTEVESEEFFQSLPNQAVVLLKQDHEKILSGADVLYDILRLINIDIIRAGQEVQLFMDENVKEKVRTLAKIIDEKENKDCKTFLSNKDEDPDWFLGLETNAKTKEAFMFRRSQERIRGYLYKTKADIKKSDLYMKNHRIQEVLDEVFLMLTNSLNKNKYFGCFFDRSSDDALCDRSGYFKCSGVWKNSECAHNGGKPHTINPYSSRETRIVFSTWNLDHRIERSRSIIPAMVNAAELVVSSYDVAVVNVPYFYSLLFTNQNLRLVHIVCHDKGKHHTAQCDPKMCTIISSSKCQMPSKTPSLKSGILLHN